MNLIFQALTTAFLKQSRSELPKAVKECSSPDSFTKTLDDYIMSLPDTPPTPVPSYIAANNNSILNWTVTSSRALHEELSSDLVLNLSKLPKLQA